MLFLFPLALGSEAQNEKELIERVHDLSWCA